jgi:hypothetical protein
VLPKDAKLKWSVLDADDPTNDDPGFHSAWGRYVDAQDYDATGKHKGAGGGDNEGKPAKNPPWQQVGSFALSGATAKECLTEITGGVSKVVFHCPDVAGDNFVIAVAIDTKTKLSKLGHQTGLITMWHRIQVDNMRMSSGLPLPLDQVPIYFEPMCVQLDCEPERVLPDKQFLSPTDDALEAKSAQYVNGVFSSKPGWFCAISALEPYPLPANKGGTLYAGPATLEVGGSGARTYEYIDVPGTLSDPDYAEIDFSGQKIGFKVFSPQPLTVGGSPFTRLWLYPHDAQPEFVAGDGSLDAAYRVTYYY